MKISKAGKPAAAAVRASRLCMLLHCALLSLLKGFDEDWIEKGPPWINRKLHMYKT
jgi:hypothetical protein